MKHATWRRKDVFSGAFIVLIGVLALWEASTYNLGTAARMGPGLFPFGLGILVIALGLGIMVIDARQPEMTSDEGAGPKASWRALFFLPLSILTFALVVSRWGLAPATLLAVFISTFADRSQTLVKSFIIACVVTVLCVIVFSYLLGLQVEVFKW